MSGILGEKGGTTLCLWQSLWAPFKHLVEWTELVLGMCSATQVSSMLLSW